jgi:hypothetical protein
MPARKKEPVPKTIADVFEEARAVITIGCGDGYASITLQNNGKHSVQFIAENGWAEEDMSHEADDLLKVTEFIKNLNALRLQEYNT